MDKFREYNDDYSYAVKSIKKYDKKIEKLESKRDHALDIGNYFYNQKNDLKSNLIPLTILGLVGIGMSVKFFNDASVYAQTDELKANVARFGGYSSALMPGVTVFEYVKYALSSLGENKANEIIKNCEERIEYYKSLQEKEYGERAL